MQWKAQSNIWEEQGNVLRFQMKFKNMRATKNMFKLLKLPHHRPPPRLRSPLAAAEHQNTN